MSDSETAAFVTVVLHAQLARYAGGRERVELRHHAGLTIADYVRLLRIPKHEYYAVIRDGRVTTDLSVEPVVGEVIELLPAVSGG